MNPSIQVKQGDCLKILQTIESNSIDLIYLDPPFFTQKIQKLKNRQRTKEFRFSDLWSSHAAYADFLYCRVREMHRVLSNTGSLFFHCDKSASHIVRILLDDVFDETNFRSEIVWYYKRWSNAKKGLSPAHQVIFFYSKSKNLNSIQSIKTIPSRPTLNNYSNKGDGMHTVKPFMPKMKKARWFPANPKKVFH